jgi:hypothetical protein
MKMRTPQNLICHPVADSGKALLHQQDRLEWCAFASPEKSRNRVAVEGVGQNWRRQPCPPRGRRLSLVEQDSPQVPPIRKNQAPSCLPQDQQVVFPNFERTWLGTKRTRHSKVQAKPGRSPFAETKEHLFATGLGVKEDFSSKPMLKLRNRDAAEDAILRPRNNHFQNLLPEANIPESPALFDFGEFRHGGNDVAR